MPSGKHRDFDDTWKHEELEKSLKGARDDRKKPRDKDREKSRKREDEDRHRKRREDDDRRDKKHRDRENGEIDRREKDRHKSSRSEDDRERRHRKHREEEDREKRHRRPKEGEEDDDRERRHRKHRDDDEERERRHRRHKDRENEDDEDRERRHRRHKDRDRRDEDDDEDRERRHRRHKDRDNEEDDDRRHKRRDEDEEERRRRKERERRHREENGERPRKHRDEDERRERRDDDRHHRRRDEDDEERRRRHEEKKRQREREKEEQRDREREEENRRQRERQKQREEEAEKLQQKERRQKERDSEKKSVQKPEEEKEADQDGYDEYEDDFEDYDDDFEDDDEADANEEESPSKGAPAQDSGEEEEEEAGHSRGYYMSLDWEPDKATRTEVDEIKKAMDEENERLSRNAQKTEQRARRKYDDRDSDGEDEDDYDHRGYQQRGKPAQRSFINFVSAKQRQITSQASSKARRRGNELLKLIELDFAKFELFDMPPVSEYDLYMRSFGSTGTRQAYVQTGDDNVDRELQTEEIETREIYTQHPADKVDPVGGPEFEKKPEEYQAVDSLALSRFIQRAGTVVLNILEEEAAERTQGALADSQQRSNICLSEAFTELRMDHLSLLKDRHVIHSRFSPLQTNLLLTVHSAKTKVADGDKHSNKGVVCVWNINEPDQPQKVLVCESRPRCCCFSPNRASLAFAGMHDGSVSVWDLREFSSMHKTYKDCDTELVLRYPTYSTAGVLQYENHQSAVVAIHPIVTPGDSASASLGTGLGDGDGGEGMSFQIATLEENSVIHLWVVAEISQPDPAGSEFDLGLSPGGCIKVIRSSTIQLESPLRDARLRTTMTAFEMQLLPSNNSHFYVATDTGCVIHGVRYGGKAPPRTYVGETDSPVRVSSVDFSPFPEPVFLAGCEDGTLRLHHIDSEYPFIVWPNATGGVPIARVRWSRSRPSVFFVLDIQSRLHIWDLTMSDAVPMKFEQIAEERVTSFEMSNDYGTTGRGQPGKKPQMVVCLKSGSAEVHTLSREFSALLPDEMDQFSQLIQKIT